jgi:hypothetical protein
MEVDPMAWQWAVVLACVLAATAYIARAAWQTWRPKAGSCGGGCGCEAAESPRVTLIPVDQIKMRRR